MLQQGKTHRYHRADRLAKSQRSCSTRVAWPSRPDQLPASHSWLRGRRRHVVQAPSRHTSSERALIFGLILMVFPACLGTVEAAPPAENANYSLIAKDGTTFSPARLHAPARVSVNAPEAAAGAPSVAIVAAAANDVSAPWFTDPQSRLVASGAFATVDLINANALTPTDVELSAYDAVLVWSNLGFADADALGDVLSGYIDDGGGVVIAVFANSSEDAADAPGGRWKTHAYEIIPPHGGTTTGAATLGTVNQPGHAIMTGVTTFSGGSSSFRPTDTTTIASGQVVAEWSDGKVLAAFRDDTVGARVDLGFYPPSDAVMANFWDATTDGDLLLVNALLYAANRTPMIPGDSDHDDNVDLDDFANFESCSTGPVTADCVTFDFDRDDDIDCDDWLALRAAWTETAPLPFVDMCIGVIPTVSEWGLAALTLCLLIVGTSLLRKAALMRPI